MKENPIRIVGDGCVADARPFVAFPAVAERRSAADRNRCSTSAVTSSLRKKVALCRCANEKLATCPVRFIRSL